MNDYARGALEALAWVLRLLDELQDPRMIRRQVEDARDDILRGSSIDFREKIRIR